jgi:DNA adenine methylase
VTVRSRENKQAHRGKSSVDSSKKLTRSVTDNLIQSSASANADLATPFIKWVGGKRSIINELLVKSPSDIVDYWEPFLGGAALFFELHHRVSKAHLSDRNHHLVTTYNVVKKNVEGLIALLHVHQTNHSEKYYYEVRAQHDLKDPVQVAARFIYLNKTCYNGLYRENRKGEFNVPVGRYVNPGIVQESNLRLCSNAFKKADIRVCDFTAIAPTANDFVYFDPPYHPISDTSSFTSYTENGFSEKDQIRLRDFALELTRSNVKIMLSNSNMPFIQNLYKSSIFNINIVHAPRSVNCKPSKRHSVEEVLICNY